MSSCFGGSNTFVNLYLYTFIGFGYKIKAQGGDIHTPLKSYIFFHLCLPTVVSVIA